MTRLLLLLLLWLPGAALAAKAPPPAPPTPAMWQVADADSKVTLFGTVHALPRGVDWFRPHVVAAIDGANALVLETLVPEGASGTLPVVLRLARTAQPRPVLERVPEAWRPQLQATLDRLKPGPMDWYKTWFIALTLANLQAQADGVDPRIGVESVLNERAKMRSLPVEALETAEQQLIFFDALSEADQQQLLISTLDELAASKGRMTILVGDWMSGNTTALAAKVDSDFERSPMLKQMLVADRNARWAAWIAEQMQKRPGHLFIAVGAGHLAGPGSLLDQLKLHGLEAKRVMPEVAKRKPARRRR